MERLLLTVLRFLFIPLLLCCGASDAAAQKPLEHNYLMEVAGMIGRDQEKVVLSAIKDQDANALISVDLPSQKLKMRTLVELDRAMIESQIAPFGLSVISLEPLFPLQVTERAMHAITLPGYPEYVNTGDPEHDEAVYQTNKAAWISAHPDLYPPAQNNVAPGPK